MNSPKQPLTNCWRQELEIRVASMYASKRMNNKMVAPKGGGLKKSNCHCKKANTMLTEVIRGLSWRSNINSTGF